MLGRDGDDMRGSLADRGSDTSNRPELQIGETPEEGLLADSEPRVRVEPSEKATARSVAERRARASETGYYISRSPDGDHLVIDGGPHGYQNGGHAHADALSLTFTSRGLPLLIDPGPCRYTTGSPRCAIACARRRCTTR